ncbi:hypothetical protein HDU86_002100 [Geranomyces michiganensis]|nr:hypothetical protein HDU86_002100 [Geranomyces michiganensis]
MPHCTHDVPPGIVCRCTPPPGPLKPAASAPLPFFPPSPVAAAADILPPPDYRYTAPLPPPPPSYKTVFPSYVATDYDPDAAILKRESWAGANLSYVGAQLTIDELFTILNHLAQNTTVRNLYLGGNNSALTDYAMPHLVRALKQNTTLVSLRIDRCSLGDAAGGMLGMILRENNTLQTLNVRDNALGETGMRRFADALLLATTTTRSSSNSSIKELDLSVNAIGDAGAQHLAGALLAGALPVLETLHLNFDGIGNAGAVALAQVIEHAHDDDDDRGCGGGGRGGRNTNGDDDNNNNASPPPPPPPPPQRSSSSRLRVLYMNENFIGIEGSQRLAAAAARNPSFQRISLRLNANLTRIRTRTDAVLRVKGALSSLLSPSTAAAANAKIITH